MGGGFPSLKRPSQPSDPPTPSLQAGTKTLVPIPTPLHVKSLGSWGQGIPGRSG